MDNVIEVSGLRRRYGGSGADGFEAVRGVDFSVRQGEIFGLLGTNGAGKTSTVELLEGLAPPTAGEVRVLGYDPYRERARVRPYTGVMLQEAGFPADLTVMETARMWAGCVSKPVPPIEVLTQVGLAGRADVRVKQLSGGERRRLDLALALTGRPRVLFLDEPSTGLDAQARKDTWQVVRDLRDQGVTIVLTTHYLEEAQDLSDRIAIMSAGRISVTGTPAEVMAARPARIRFRLPRGLDPAHLPLPGPVDVWQGKVDAQTHDVQRDLTRLLVWAQEAGVELADLDARAATLEEVFLSLTQEAAR
ncbi:ABC transporter ATP-binding protein [Streptomyces marincola]|uniref:Multidrug ABC transporter ATP-binding protein n=1 Tax=Streptomyces marincola TaxID=2878388 RepID=A0A1W7CXY5_9ACTN|nr:ABC transporter ATP-binding protein [Streptomyces marincola]ARQ69567.1 multidrug ABC transporter ATP-binding protein [Streptomyces marincola]